MIAPEDFKKALTSLPQLVSEKNKAPKVFKLSVKKKFDGFSLLELYTQSFPHVDRNFWLQKIESGNIQVDQKPGKVDQILRAGQITQHSVPARPEPEVNWEIKLLLATQDYWVLSKPSPLPVHAGGRYLYNTLTAGLKMAFPNQSFHLINRLDANTTGIVLVALNKSTATLLSKQFEKREVHKTYLAVVEGHPIENTFSSQKGISKEKTPAGGRQLVEDSESKTDFKFIKDFTSESLLEVIPHSGHTNQIRLHLAGLGLPIKGDLGYKTPAYFESHPLTYPKDSLFLHAWKLQFRDPVSNAPIKVKAHPNKKWDDYLS